MTPISSRAAAPCTWREGSGRAAGRVRVSKYTTCATKSARKGRAAGLYGTHAMPRAPLPTDGRARHHDRTTPVGRVARRPAPSQPAGRPGIPRGTYGGRRGGRTPASRDISSAHGRLSLGHDITERPEKEQKVDERAGRGHRGRAANLTRRGPQDVKGRDPRRRRARRRRCWSSRAAWARSRRGKAFLQQRGGTGGARH